MSYLDIFLLILLVFAIVKGYMRGLVVELFSFVGFFLGLFAAIELTIPVANEVVPDGPYFQLVTIGVFIALFILVVIVMNLLGKIIKKAIDITLLGYLDNVLGSVASVIKWAFALSVVVWVFESIGFSLSGDFVDQSRAFPYIKMVGPMVFDWLSGILPFIRDMIDSLENIGEDNQAVFTFLYF